MERLVSIITPCYEAERFIAESIRSVQSQTYENWELILVNDASRDRTQEIIRKFQKEDKRLKLISNDVNVGAALSRNIALDNAAGSYVAFLDSDDLWLPSKLEKQLDFMDKQDVLMCYSAYNLINSDGMHLGCFYPKKKVTYRDLLKSSDIGTLTTIYNTKKLGKFYFENIGHEDYLMKLQILKRIHKAKAVDGLLASYRITERSLSRDKIRAAKWQWNIYRNFENISFFLSLFYFGHYLLRGVYKDSKRYLWLFNAKNSNVE